MAIICPNCHIPCVGCAGAKITTASDGATVCTKCIQNYEWTVANKKKEEFLKEDSNLIEPSPPLNKEIKTYQIAPVINSVTSDYRNFNK